MFQSLLWNLTYETPSKTMKNIDYHTPVLNEALFSWKVISWF